MVPCLIGGHAAPESIGLQPIRTMAGGRAMHCPVQVFNRVECARRG